MISPAEIVLTVLVFSLVLGLPAVCLVSMRRHGRGWARTRIVSYTLASTLYGLNGVVLFGRGNRLGGFLSAMIAWYAGKGALAAWRAYGLGDFRPAHMRSEGGTPLPSADPAARLSLEPTFRR